jgi:hypothetical protein
MVLHKQRFDVMMVSPWQTSTFVVSVYTRHLYLQMAGSDAALEIARLWTRTYTPVSVGRCQWLSKPEREQGLGGKRRQLYSLHQSHLLVGCDPVGFLATVKKRNFLYAERASTYGRLSIRAPGQQYRQFFCGSLIALAHQCTDCKTHVPRHVFALAQRKLTLAR